MKNNFRLVKISVLLIVLFSTASRGQTSSEKNMDSLQVEVSSVSGIKKNAISLSSQLSSLPGWIERLNGFKLQNRFDNAVSLLRTLNFLKDRTVKMKPSLHLSSSGREWLAQKSGEQLQSVKLLFQN